MELIHTNVVGPLPDVNGYKYFLAIVDDHSRYTIAYPMRAKSEVEQCLKLYIAAMERLSD